MPTIKQKRAVANLVGNGGNITKAMRDAGYSENTLNTPQKLTESKGYKDTLAEYGLTEELITTALVEDIQKKPQNRVGELTLASKIRGMQIDKKELTGRDGVSLFPKITVLTNEASNNIKALYEGSDSSNE